MAERVLITGGTGFLGSALLRGLQVRGLQITSVTRHPSSNSSVRTISMDDLAAETHHDIVINLAGENVLGLWTPSKKKAIYDSRIETTQKVASWIQSLSHKPRVFLAGSAVGIYGDQANIRLTEDANTAEVEGFLPKVCRDWEAAASVEGVRTVVLRTSNVLDPSGGYLKAMLKAMKLLPPVVLGKKDAYVPWISLADWVSLALFCIDNDQIGGPVNFATPEPVTQQQMTETIARKLRKKVLLTVPKPLLTMLLGQFGESILASERVIGQKAIDAGFKFAHPDLDSYFQSVSI